MATIPNDQKILTSAAIVNTTYGGPASLQALNTWYTMDDISNTVRPYKVYTALLTQSGEAGESYLYGPSNLVVGVTYTITFDPNLDCDFTNVGAPNNNVGTSFVATGTTPNSWGSLPGDTELQYFTGAPVVTVLENTIGNIWFTYSAVGEYNVNSNALFTTDKTFIVIVAGSAGRPDILATYETNTDSNIILNSYRVNADEVRNDLLLNTSIEIRVYN